MRGQHMLMHWSRTQQTVALSSAEAELNAICKASQEGLAARYMSAELNSEHSLVVKTDASIGVLSSMRLNPRMLCSASNLVQQVVEAEWVRRILCSRFSKQISRE